MSYIMFSTFRWDISMINLLPEYMKVYYIALLDLFEEINKETMKDGTSYRAHFAKEAVKILIPFSHNFLLISILPSLLYI